MLISVRHINTCVRLLEKSSRNILLFPASPREPALALAPPSPPPAPATAPSRRPRRSLPRSLPTHPYNLRPIPGRTRVPNSLVSVMSGPPTSTLPPPALALTAPSPSSPVDASTVSSASNSSGAPLTLESLAVVVDRIGRSVDSLQAAWAGLL